MRFINGGYKVFCVADEHSISSCIEMISQPFYMTGGIGWAASKFLTVPLILQFHSRCLVCFSVASTIVANQYEA